MMASFKAYIRHVNHEQSDETLHQRAKAIVV